MFAAKRFSKISALTMVLLMAFLIIVPVRLQAENVFEGEYFSLEYPADWISREEAPQGMILEFVLLAPEEVAANEFTSNLNVMAEELQQDLSVEEYTELVLMQVENMLEDFALIEQQEIMVDGREAAELTYSGIAEDEAGDYNLTWRQAIMIEDELAYIVTLTAEQEVFSDYQNIYDNVVESLSVAD